MTKQSKWLTTLVAVLGGSTLMACQPSQTQVLKPAAVTYTATLSDPVCGSAVVLQGHTTQIQLKSNPTTGYSWLLATPEKAFKVTNSRYIANKGAEGMVGIGGVQIFSLQAVQQGAVTLRFEYVRPWEKDVAPVHVKTCDIKVV